MDDMIQKTIENLKALALDGDSHENLSAICSVLYKPEFGWTIGACSTLRDGLVGMLEQLDPDEWADEYLDEVGLMRLPKDADGIPIHVGDEMLDFEHNRVTVMWVYPGGYMYFENDDYMAVVSPHLHHHYHAPTIEEVLRELVDEVQRCCDTENTIAEYAAKLRELMADE